MSRAHTFDDLARRLAEPMPRSRAVRVIGTALAAAAAPVISPRIARAAPRGGSDIGPSVCPGAQICSTYIDPNAWSKGQKHKCCPFPKQQWTCGPDGFTCTDTCTAAGNAIGKRTKPTWSAARDSHGVPKKYDCCPIPDTIPSDGECLPNCKRYLGPQAIQCGKTCCPPASRCAPGNRCIPCPSDRECGGTCCNPSATCKTDGKKYYCICPDDRSQCGSTCCKPDETCKNGKCCKPGAPLCDGECCAQGETCQKCLDSQQGSVIWYDPKRRKCCPPDSECCGGSGCYKKSLGRICCDGKLCRKGQSCVNLDPTVAGRVGLACG